jgi:hypothetical protein
MKALVKRSISRVSRYAAREFADELQRRQATSDPHAAPVQIDVAHFVKELSSGKLNQSLVHLFTWNHRWIAQLAERNRRTAVSTYDFIEAEMQTALFTINQMEVISAKRDELIELDGQILDLGVYKGASTRALARIYPEREIHGFDSFEGLPGDWSHVMKGDFGDVNGMLPDMPENVKLYKGWFDDTLPEWIKHHSDSPISILRVDCDIYSSTKTIFDVLEPLIVEGTWIVFDELIGLRGWEQHEHKAFMEFIDRTGFEYRYVAYGLTYTIVRLGTDS